MVTLRFLNTDKRLPNGFLSLVWEANRIEDGFFSTPTLAETDDSDFEEYPDARIVHRKGRTRAPLDPDPRVVVKAKSERGNRVLAAVAKHFGLDVEE